ncbi:hypothetical protein [Clostridium sp. DL1XJH146]
MFILLTSNVFGVEEKIEQYNICVSNNLAESLNGDLSDKIKKYHNEKVLEKSEKYKKYFNKELITDIDAINSDKNNQVYVYSYDDLAFDKKLLKKIVKKLDKGNSLYLYGNDITPKMFTELLGEEFNFGVSDAEYESLKNDTLEKGVPAVEENQGYDLIGYSNNGEDISLYNFEVYDRDSEVLDPEMIIVEVLDSLSKRIEAKRENNVKLLGYTLPLVNKSLAMAASQQVKSAFNINTPLYVGTSKIANLNTDWVLYKDNNEVDKDYDNFTVKTNYEVADYHQLYYYYQLDVTHDLPFSADNIWEWLPADKNEAAGTISVAIPWALYYNFSLENVIDIDRQGSQASDYGRWIVDNDGAAMANNERFQPSTAWYSTGTYAGIDSKVTFKFRDGHGNVKSATQNINIRYDY